MGLLNTLEEGIVFRAALRSALVGMMLENLLAVGAFNLVFGGAVTIL